MVTWFDIFQNPGHSSVLTGDGDFSGIAPGTQADMFNGWVFNPSTADSRSMECFEVGFTFDLASATIVTQSNFFLNVLGEGTISGNGFDDTPGTFALTIDNSDGRPRVRFGFASEYLRFLMAALPSCCLALPLARWVWHGAS